MVMDKQNKNRELRKRYRELAAMLKEKMKGNMVTLDKILGKFSMQEGIKFTRAKEYLNLFEMVGLVKITTGRKKWKYNSDAEWELFRVLV